MHLADTIVNVDVQDQRHNRRLAPGPAITKPLGFSGHAISCRRESQALPCTKNYDKRPSDSAKNIGYPFHAVIQKKKNKSTLNLL
jgi:hypothetical protein